MVTSVERAPELEALVDYLKRSRGFDFSGYKRASLSRRIQKRMQTVKADGYAAYQDYLASDPGEFEELFNTILINVTAFFRDEDAWAFLRDEVVPQLIAQKGPSDPIRVWSAGSASGEEAYSLAIVFAEAMGLEESRERVKIYATDVDEAALMAARQATYTARDVGHLPPEIVEKYFERSETRYVFRKDLRRSVVFGRNDLIQDAPISRIDLLACRNCMMYFDRPTQARILSRFFFALNEGGYLFLGRAETLLTHATTLVPIDAKRRIFRKATRGSGGVRPAAGRQGAEGIDDGNPAPAVRDAALRAGAVAQLIVDRQGTLIFANDRANGLLELETTNEELETTNEELQSTVEEFETTNEELQSTNEELQTMNDELQSTNEELQTMNQELQIRRDELNQLNRFLEQVFTSLRHGVAVVDADFRILVWNSRAEDLWGVRADEVAGAHLLSLDIGLPVDQLKQPIRAALAAGDGAVQETVLPATNRRGRPIQCRIISAPLVGREGSEPDGVIVIMEEIGPAD